MYPKELPVEKLPPAESLPEKIFALPELHYPKKINIGKIFVDDNAKRYRDKAAILYNDQSIKYGELQTIVNKVGNALLDYGIKRCDRIALVTPNIPEHIYVLMACWKIGAIPVLCSHLEKSDRLAYKFRDSDSKIAVVTSESLEEVKKAKEESDIEDIICVEKCENGFINFYDLINSASPDLDAADTSRDHIGRIIYTSGTTGLPKGVLATYSDILSAGDTFGKYVLGVKSSDVIGGHPYFFFAFGSVNFTFIPWRFGATLSIIRRFTPELMFKTIEKHRITILCCVPTAFNMMLQITDAEKKYDLSSLRLAQSAGEPLPRQTIVEFEKRFGIRIIDALGSSELNYWVSTRADTPFEKLGSTGLPVPGYEVKIIDPETGEEVDCGEVGVMYTRGPMGFQYWNKPEKQKSLIVNGWSNTELFFKKDEEGYLWYVSRSDDMIITSGYKISPHEVENAILTHPAVQEVAVIPKPDEVRGSIIKAFIVLKEGYEPNDDLARNIQEHVKQVIEPYKYPREIEFLNELPKTVTGKIQRFLLVQREKDRMRREHNE